MLNKRFYVGKEREEKHEEVPESRLGCATSCLAEYERYRFGTVYVRRMASMIPWRNGTRIIKAI